MTKIAGKISQIGRNCALGSSILSIPNFAVKVLEKHAGKIEGVSSANFCSMLSYIAANKEATAETKASVVKVSGNCFNAAPEGEAALAAAYHAKSLFSAGKKEDAMVWIDKAASLVDKFNPENQRPGILKFINDAKKQFSANG